jgi:uncharacterized membrane protein
MNSSCADLRAQVASPCVAPPTTFVITPHMSMSDGMATAIYLAIFLAAAIVQLPFLQHGLWPVSIFSALDAAGLVVALHVFRICQRHRREEILLADGALLIRRHSFRSEVKEQKLECYGLSIERHDDPDFGCRRLLLVLRERRIEVARDLSPIERESFSRAFIEALRPLQIPIRTEVAAGWALLTKGPYAP